MRHSSFIATALVLITLSSCAQSKYGIKRADAYFKQISPGNVPVDEQGHSLYHGPDTVIIVYVETSGSSIEWIGAWKGNKYFSVNSVAITGTPVQVGTSATGNKSIEIRPAKGNKLWLLGLEKKEVSSTPPPSVKGGGIILQGRIGKKNFIQKVSPPIELTAVPSV